jgi:hypothetical protein
MDRGAIALQVNEGNAKLVTLPDPPASWSVSAHKLYATLGSDGSAQLEWRADVSGVDAAEWRTRFHADATRKQRVEQMLAALLPGADVSSVDGNDLENLEEPVTMRVHGKAPQFARLSGDLLDVPLGRHEHMVRDYAPLASRQLDVRLQAQWTQDDDWTVRLPAGARIRSVPSSSHGSGVFGSYDVEVESAATTLRARTRVTMSKTRIAPIEYSAFRAWCEEVDRALGARASVALR